MQVREGEETLLTRVRERDDKRPSMQVREREETLSM